MKSRIAVVVDDDDEEELQEWAAAQNGSRHHMHDLLQYLVGLNREDRPERSKMYVSSAVTTSLSHINLCIHEGLPGTYSGQNKATGNIQHLSNFIGH